MKKLAYNLLILSYILVFSLESEANDRYDIEKSKKISKSYSVKENVKLDIDNSFGKVHINTWDKSTITVDIEIIVKMRSEERAQNLLDKIEIDIAESSSIISFETKLGSNLRNKNEEEFEINYQINMPKENPLKLKNSFGETYVSDLNGDAEIKVSYGDIRTGALNGDSDIKISFSDGTLEYVKEGYVEIKYSDVEIDEIGAVKLEQGFSDVEIGKAGTLDLTSKYGDVEIGTVKGIKGYVGYSDFSIELLEVELDMEASYSGGFTVSEVSRSFSSVKIDGKFSDYRIGFADGTNFNFDVSLKFSDFSYSGLPLDFDYKVKEDFRSQYRGSVGEGKGGEVQIDTSYGDIRFR